jgi:hypothetical protein
MTGYDLLQKLNAMSIDELEQPIRIINEDVDDEENIWVNDIEVSRKGESGYEENGEIRIIGSE